MIERNPKSGWTRSEPPPRDRRIYDPYYDWAQLTGFKYYGETEWLPVLIELEKTDSKAFAANVFRMNREGWASLLRIPPIYGAPPKRLQKPLRFLTAMVKHEFLTRVQRGEPPSQNIRRIEVGRKVDLAPDMTGNGGWGADTPGQKDVTPGAAVIGIIDDSLAFAHDRFRSAQTSTRIHYFWDQLVPSGGSGRWDYGREICKHDTAVTGIDRLLQNCLHGGVVDEDEVYRLAGFLDHRSQVHKALALRASHGTHVADLASNPSRQGLDPIVAVQLPIATTEDTSGATLKPQVFDALMYMVDRADHIAQANGLSYLPLVVNLSYGMYAGPHDGTGLVEQAIDNLIAATNTNPNQPLLQVVIPSGNGYLLRCHAAFSLTSKHPSEELRWRLQPDDGTENFLEIWYPDLDSSGQSADLQITITSPDGETTSFGAGNSNVWMSTGAAAGQAVFYPAAAGSKRKLFKISLAPTVSLDGTVATAPAGIWTVVVRNGGHGEIKDIDAWIQRDEAIYGYRKGARQSYFDDPKYAVFDAAGRPIENDSHKLTRDSSVKREGTLNAIANGQKAIVVAGLQRSTWKPAPYSAGGPLLPPGRRPPSSDGPDVMVACDDTPSHRGLLAAGSRSGSCVAMHGTSVAAPQVARWTAGDLAGNGKGDRDAVTEHTKAVVAPPDYTEKNPPPGAAPRPVAARGGVGRMDFRSWRRPRFER